MKRLFSIAPVKIFGKLRECFSIRNTYQMQVLAASDAALAHPVRCQSQALVSRAHRSLNVGRSTFTVRASGGARRLQAFLTRALDAPESVRWSASGDVARFTNSLHTCLLCTGCVRCSLDCARWFASDPLEIDARVLKKVNMWP